MKIKLKTNDYKLIIKIKFEDQKYLQPIDLKELIKEVTESVGKRKDISVPTSQE